ncbi:Endoplasmic reticulum aminopeptidase 2 [Araneus ventricosus]|uniref:Endoplasmic reticulum aminopeptidase 2 n=1 Tax=Araneus ventricosus TaxID=182803 RepID=A0A4Y2KFC8_ARAVE|nr:Endoplasmic reticulum aminopeptidase 2 [Araneus ventricosus]
MSTHLLAIVVCDFPFEETLTENGVKVRIYTAPHHLQKAEYALSSASKILTYYEKYFGVPFPLKKLDLAVIPDLARSGAENWGLITLREDSVLCGGDCPMATKYRLATLLAKQLAHQWFGDLVTMRWWDEQWLNEGFSTYISRKGVKHVEPDLDKEDDIELLRLTDAMISDRAIYSRPIVQRVEKVSEMYDDIECKKGSSILRMLENSIGDDFREGISVSSSFKMFSFKSLKPMK